MLSPEIAVLSKAVGNSTSTNSNQDNHKLSVKASLGGGGGCRGKNTTGSSTTKALPIPPASRCPRCDSPNTKFCYYNNYSLAQPRHFCKTCRRYWTKGGALRNVPIGGGCRKNNKSKCKSSSTSTSSVDYNSKDYSSTSYLSSDNIPGSGGSGFLLNSSIFHGLNSLSSSSSLEVCHQHDQLGGRIPFSLLNSSATTGVDATAGSLMKMRGFSTYNDNLAGSSSAPAFLRDQQETCPSIVTNGYQGSYHGDHLTSSIVSLSNMNQELHWKLQQQRLAMLFGVRNHQHNQYSNTSINTTTEVAGLENQLQHAQKLPLPVSFQNLEISKQEAAAGAVSIDQIIGLQRGVHDAGDDSANYNAQTTTDQWSIFDKYNSATNNNSSTPINTVTTGANEKVIGSWNDIQAWNTTTTGHQHFAPLL